MKFFLTCLVLAGSLFSASTFNALEQLNTEYREQLGVNTLLPVNFMELAASSRENFCAYQEDVKPGVTAEHPDFSRVAAARTILTPLFEEITKKREALDLLPDILQDAIITDAKKILNERKGILDKLDDELYSLYGKIQP